MAMQLNDPSRINDLIPNNENISRSYMLDSALEYASRGWKVLPLYEPTGHVERVCSCKMGMNCQHPGKHPRTLHGVKDATDDPDQIRKWWKMWPNASIGIATGSTSNIVVMDIDPRKGGNESLNSLIKQYGRIPDTCEVLSGGLDHGRHFYFLHPGQKVKNTTLFSGIDIRGEGAYIVAPPSVHISGNKYYWDGLLHPSYYSLAEMPEWLLELVNGSSSAGQSQSDIIPKGKRNTTLASIAGKLRRNGMEESAIEQELHTINSERCDPPLNHDDIARIAQSIGNYPKGCKTGTSLKEKLGHLFAIADNLEFFITTGNQLYCSIPTREGRRKVPVDSRDFSDFLIHAHYRKTGEIIGKNSFHDCLPIMRAEYLQSAQKRESYIRVAELDNAIYVDLCTNEGHVVEIDSFGWKVIKDSPVVFETPSGMKTLPIPKRGGNLDHLKSFLNIQSDEQFILIVSWLMGTLRNKISFPLLAIHGQQGSGKSTMSRILKNLLDPSAAPTRSFSSKEDDLLVAAGKTRILAFDNLTRLNEAMSNSLCRLATGGGQSKKKNYADLDEVVIETRNPVILNGIGDLALRPDLASRTLVLNLDPVKKRVTEAEVERLFAEAHPFILGALFDAASCGLRNINNVNYDELPRMADFAQWIIAAEPLLPWKTGEFMEIYDTNRSESSLVCLENDPIALALEVLLDLHGNQKCNATELLRRLRGVAKTSDIINSSNLPISSNHFTGRLRQLAPDLTHIGINARETKSRGKKRWIIERSAPGVSIESNA